MKLSNIIRWLGVFAIIGGIGKILFSPLEMVFGVDSAPALLTSGLAATFLVIVGLIGIYLYQAEKAGVLGFIGFSIITLGHILYWGILYIFLFVNTALLEPKILEELMAQNLPGPINTLQLIGFISLCLGYILFGISIIRAKVLPRWTGVAMILSVLLFFVPIAFVEDAIEVIWGITYIGLGWTIWSKAKSTVNENMV